MSCANSVARSCSRSCARAVNARHDSSYPAALALLWPLKLSDAGVLKSAKGAAPTFTDTPTVTADGVAPGDGPTWHYDPAIWRQGDSIYVRWTATVASADVVDDVEILYPVYATSGGLKATDGTNSATVAATWTVGDVLTIGVRMDGDDMQIGVEGADDAADVPASLALLWPSAATQAGAQTSYWGPAPEWSYTGAQYDADGVSVGAVPAWHTSKGVWCGPGYTQRVLNSKFAGAASGTPGTAPTNWTLGQTGGSLAKSGDSLTFSATSARQYIWQSFSLLASTTYYFTFTGVFDGVLNLRDVCVNAGSTTGMTVSYEENGVSRTPTFVPAAGTREITFVLALTTNALTVEIRLGVGSYVAITGAGSVTISRPALTALRNAPYVATGAGETITVASAAGTSGGNGLAWAKSTKMGAIFDGQGTVACKVTLGAASSAVTTDTNILTVDDTAVGLIYAASGNKLKSNDGTNTAEVSCTWAANDELLVVAEMSEDTFRIGFAKTADAAITWGDPATYDGSHNSGTKLRLALLNSIPMWADGVYVSNKTGLTAADIRRHI